MNGPRRKIRAKTRKNRDNRLQWPWRSTGEFNVRPSFWPAITRTTSKAAHLQFLEENHYSLHVSRFHSRKSQAFQDFSTVQDDKEVYQVSNQPSY